MTAVAKLDCVADVRLKIFRSCEEAIKVMLSLSFYGQESVFCYEQFDKYFRKLAGLKYVVS